VDHALAGNVPETGQSTTMLKGVVINGYKSLIHLDLAHRPLTVPFGPMD